MLTDGIQNAINKSLGRPGRGEISKREVERMQKKMNAPKRLLMEMSRSEQKKLANNSRVLRQMDGDTIRQRISSYRNSVFFHINAALDENDYVVNALQNKRQDRNARDDGGRTALHYACRFGADHTVYSLLREEAPVDEPDYLMRWTPMHYAVRGGSKKVVTMLLQNAPKPKITASRKDKTGMTPLMLAAAEGQLRVAEVLIFEGADVTDVDDEGWTPLHFSAFYDQPGTAELLIDFGANLNARTKITRETPIEMAERLNKTRVALMLYDVS